ncbi:hypothetical protein K449DRAFT_438599 [Hypoxylon sp. EC38]|nr:hypothetical protein K449DRAFT_438599 [Hypoxylon sp. EC38]
MLSRQRGYGESGGQATTLYISEQFEDTPKSFHRWEQQHHHPSHQPTKATQYTTKTHTSMHRPGHLRSDIEDYREDDSRDGETEKLVSQGPTQGRDHCQPPNPAPPRAEQAVVSPGLAQDIYRRMSFNPGHGRLAGKGLERSRSSTGMPAASKAL